MADPSEKELQSLRERIDELDDRLLQLISERGDLARQTARAKGDDKGRGCCYRPEREAEILRRIEKLNPGPFPAGEITRLFREIMSACLALEQPLKVAYLGPEGTYTHAAALKHFGHSVEAVSLSDIASVFQEVESGAVQFGVVPVENSAEGMIHHTLDMFLNSPLKICGEVELRIHHCLLGKVETLDEIERIYAHPQAFAQCRKWLDNHLPAVERIGLDSNAEGARKAAGEQGSAAIAAATAAEIYGLTVLTSGIEDESDNATRFLVIGDMAAEPSGADKTSLLVSVRNRPGALYKLLEPIGRHNISMTRIESRPSKRAAWDYVFFVDLEGHAGTKPVAAALAELEEQASFVKVLGSYPSSIN